jgi:hypothetical protein
MALSNEDKQRIRQEEEFRLEVQRELKVKANETNRWKVYVFWLVLAAAAVLLYTLIRTH